MPLINSPHPDALNLGTLPATDAQVNRLRSYSRDAYSPITCEGDTSRLTLLLARWTDCTETGKRWYGRIRVTLDQTGKVIASQVYSAEVVKLATADEPPKRGKQAKPAADPTPAPEPELPPIKAGHRVRLCGLGELAGVEGVVKQGEAGAITVQTDGGDTVVTTNQAKVELIAGPARQELPTQPAYQPGQRIRFAQREHDELAGTLGTIEQVSGDHLLVRSDEAGLVTVEANAVELVGEVAATKQSRQRRQRPKAS